MRNRPQLHGRRCNRSKTTHRDRQGYAEPRAHKNPNSTTKRTHHHSILSHPTPFTKPFVSHPRPCSRSPEQQLDLGSPSPCASASSAPLRYLFRPFVRRRPLPPVSTSSQLTDLPTLTSSSDSHQ